jgi:membrane-bound ClpP family serine protease
MPAGRLFRLIGAAVIAVSVAWVVLFLIGSHAIVIEALAGLGTFGVVYLGVTSAFGIPEAGRVLGQLRRGGMGDQEGPQR